MSRVLLLDTNVWSHLLLGTPEKRAQVQARLQQLRTLYPDATLATSRICIAEALVAARRLADPQAVQQAEDSLQGEFRNPNLVVVEITDVVFARDIQVYDLAASLRGEALRAAALHGCQRAADDGGRLKLPDAIIAASCLVFSQPAVLVTENVADFRLVSMNGHAAWVAGLTVQGI